jgi:predicted component of type VI protein secretion system
MENDGKKYKDELTALITELSKRGKDNELVNKSKLDDMMADVDAQIERQMHSILNNKEFQDMKCTFETAQEKFDGSVESIMPEIIKLKKFENKNNFRVVVYKLKETTLQFSLTD